MVTKNLAAEWGRSLPTDVEIGKVVEITSSLHFHAEETALTGAGIAARLVFKPSGVEEKLARNIVWEDEPCPDLERLGWSLSTAADDLALWRLSAPSNRRYTLEGASSGFSGGISSGAVGAAFSGGIVSGAAIGLSGAFGLSGSFVKQEGTTWFLMADRLRGPLFWRDEGGEGLMLGRDGEAIYAAPVRHRQKEPWMSKEPKLATSPLDELARQAETRQAWLAAWSRRTLERGDPWSVATAAGVLLRLYEPTREEKKARMALLLKEGLKTFWPPAIQTWLDEVQETAGSWLFEDFGRYTAFALEEAREIERELFGEEDEEDEGQAAPPAFQPFQPSENVSRQEVLVRSQALFHLRDDLESVAFVLGRKFSKKITGLLAPLDALGRELVVGLPDSPLWHDDPRLRAAWLGDHLAWWVQHLNQDRAFEKGLEAAIRSNAPAAEPSEAALSLDAPAAEPPKPVVHPDSSAKPSLPAKRKDAEPLLLLPPEEIQRSSWYQELSRQGQEYGADQGAEAFLQGRMPLSFSASDAPQASVREKVSFAPLPAFGAFERVTLFIPQRFSSSPPSLRLLFETADELPFAFEEDAQLVVGETSFALAKGQIFLDIPAQSFLAALYKAMTSGKAPLEIRLTDRHIPLRFA